MSPNSCLFQIFLSLDVIIFQASEQKRVQEARNAVFLARFGCPSGVN